jgi:hypothetical protein
MMMEYVDGGTMTPQARPARMLPPQVAIPLCKEALLGGSCARRMGTVHRDIKPANLMVNNCGILKVKAFRNRQGDVRPKHHTNRCERGLGRLYFRRCTAAEERPGRIRRR